MRSRLPLLSILAAAAALRAWGLSFGLPHTLTRPDEEAVFSVTLGVFSRRFDPHFFDWPSLYLYIVSLGHAVYFNLGRLVGHFHYELDFIQSASLKPAPLFLTARLVTATMAVLTVWLVYRIATRLFDHHTALIAAVFLTVAPLHVRDSHFGTPDITATAVIAASFLCTLRYWQTHSRLDALLAALLAGLAASTKYNAGLIALPAVVAVLSARADPTHRRRESWALKFLLVATMGGVSIVAFFAGTPYALLDWPEFIAALRRISSHLAGGHAAFAGWAWGVHLRSTLWYGMGWPLFLLSLGGLLFYPWRGGSGGRLTVLFPVTYFIVIGAGQTAFARYVLPVVPFLCLTAAWAVSIVAAWLRDTSGSASPVFSWAVAALVMGLSLSTSVQSDRLLTRTDTRLLTAQWIAHAYPQGASIYQAGSGYGQVQMDIVSPGIGARYPLVDFDEAAGAFRKDGSDLTPRLVVVQQHPLIYSQPPGAIPGIVAHRYERRAVFPAASSFEGAVFDGDDAFYVPLSGFGRMERPGPNLVVYEVADASAR